MAEMRFVSDGNRGRGKTRRRRGRRLLRCDYFFFLAVFLADFFAAFFFAMSTPPPFGVKMCIRMYLVYQTLCSE